MTITLKFMGSPKCPQSIPLPIFRKNSANRLFLDSWVNEPHSPNVVGWHFGILHEMGQEWTIFWSEFETGVLKFATVAVSLIPSFRVTPQDCLFHRGRFAH